MIQPIRAVIFDVGETLIDETRLYHGWADTMGVGRDAFMAELDDVILKGEPHRRVFERLKPDFDFAAARTERSRRGLDFAIEMRDLYEDAAPCIAALKGQGWLIGIAGNQPRTAKAALHSFGLEADFIANSTELGADKPSPQFFRGIVELAGLPASEILYVGDRVDNDIIPGHASGLRTALLERGPWGRNHGQLPEAALATFRIKTLAELPPLVAEANAMAKEG